ncbi:MAG: DUF167 domain-containing protein [Anaerolineae bacterium]|jgi:hypothetical protein|nr:DUF167 domain-containing protein [Anaerolineae bacterium]
MTKVAGKFHDGKRGAALAVRVTPRSAKNQLAGILADGTLKVKITGAPVDGKANQVLLNYLSEMIGVPTSALEIVAGWSSKNKLIAVNGIYPKELDDRIAEHLEK